MLRKGIREGHSVGWKEGRVLIFNKGRKKGCSGRKDINEGMLNEVLNKGTHTHTYIHIYIYMCVHTVEPFRVCYQVSR
jgi:hypothetical protein